MLDSPHTLSETHDTPRTVEITDASVFRMPRKCVVCGTDMSTFYSYTQDHVPLVLPGVGMVRTTQVWLPYCEQHYTAFTKRFRRLRTVQRVAYVMFLVCTFTIFFEPVRKCFGWAPEPDLVSVLLGGMLFLLLVVTIFCIKPFLYDAFVKQSGHRLRITSRSTLFMRNIIEANERIVQ